MQIVIKSTSLAFHSPLGLFQKGIDSGCVHANFSSGKFKLLLREGSPDASTLTQPKNLVMFPIIRVETTRIDYCFWFLRGLVVNIKSSVFHYFVSIFCDRVRIVF